MKKSILAVILVLSLLFTAAGFAEAEPVEKKVTLHTNAGTENEMTLRFFSETPHVPYLGINEYLTKIVHFSMSMEKDEEGVLTLKNDLGGELRCDIAAGTVSTPDWIRAITPRMPLENGAKSLKDSSCGFVRVTDIAYEGEAAPITFDFAKYGIRIYADDQDVYLPLSVLSNMMTDIATNHLRYDGESLYLERISLTANANDPILMNETMKALLAGDERPEDLIGQCYADLCFDFDYFFGHPGKAALDAAIDEKGLDGALTDLGEEGEALKAALHSPRMGEYLSALQKLFTVYLADGHTVALDISSLMQAPEVLSNRKLSRELSSDYLSSLLESKNTMKQVLHMAITPQRRLAWGDDAYREYGNTAIIRLDTFMPDEAAWESWYKGEGAFPEDCVGTVVTGLRRASENADIKNVLIDLTCNGGGSSDVLMLILGVTTGQNQLYGRNRLTGQEMRITYASDNNFDGVFDEKDQEARFDFNYGVLTTRQAFSCGNLCPIIMREGGAVVIGEPTSGGSCCIQVGADSLGIRYLMSSCQWQIVDSTGKDVEGGCTVDVPIRAKGVSVIDNLITGLLGVDEGLPVFTDYFDEEYLNTLMNAWFHVENEQVPAA